MRSWENYTLFSALASLGIFIGYAYRTPIHKKLYKELGYSVLMGFSVSYSYVYYHYLNYIEVVDECYNLVK